MKSEIDKAYESTYKGFGKPNVGALPAPPKIDSDLAQHLFWQHVACTRADSKGIPLKPRRKLTPEEWAKLKRRLETLAHQTRHALALMGRF